MRDKLGLGSNDMAPTVGPEVGRAGCAPWPPYFSTAQMDLHLTGRLLLDCSDKNVYHVHLEVWLSFMHSPGRLCWRVMCARKEREKDCRPDLEIDFVRKINLRGGKDQRRTDGCAIVHARVHIRLCQALSNRPASSKQKA